MAKSKKTFEEAISELEKVVDFLEKGELSLDEGLAKFQEGMALAKFCNDELEKAEKKIAIITEEGVEENFEVD